MVVKIPHSFLVSDLGTFPIFHDISTCSYFQHHVHDMSISHCISLCLVDFDVSLRRLPAGRADPALAVYLDRSVTSAKTCAVNPMTMAKKWQKDPKIETKYYKILQSNEKASTNHKKLHKKWIEHVLSKCSRVAVLWKKHEKAASDTSSLVIALLQFAHFFATPFAQLSWAAKAGPGQGIR